MAKKKNFGAIGMGYKDKPGALELGESGEPKWRETIAKVINDRSKNPKRNVVDLID